MLDRIAEDLGQLPKAEARVARVVLADPETLIRSSLSAVAKAAGVSEPTVLRFCRGIGHEGFPAFKIALAQHIAAGVPYVSPHVLPADDAATTAQKLFTSSASALHATARALDTKALKHMVDRLIRAHHILIFGVGGSAALGNDTYHKMVRLKVTCHATADDVMARMVLASLGTDDALFALSYTGRTRTVLELSAAAQDRGIDVLGVTVAGSPLAQICDIALTIPQVEDSEIFTPMASRIAMLAIIDVITTSMAMRDSKHAADRLAAIKRLVSETRVPTEIP